MASERRKLIAEGVKFAREQLANLPESNAPCEFDNFAEAIAYQVAMARRANVDEAMLVEITLTAALPSRESLLEAEEVLRQLGYADVAKLLRRLARRAQPRPSREPRKWRCGTEIARPKRLH